MSREIQLTQGMTAIVDDEDYPELSKYKWYVSKHHNTFYAERNSQMIGGKPRHKIRMHTLIVPPQKGMVTDHKNGNGLDNRRENLRSLTPRENLQNLHIKKTSVYPGVSQSNKSRNWVAFIQIGKKKKYLGTFATEEEAFGIS